jgi:Caenorhabditis protein of unknown function, DUF268
MGTRWTGSFGELVVAVVKVRPPSLSQTLGEFGLDIGRLRLLRYVPAFARDIRAWLAQGGRVSQLFPIFSDWSEQAGTARGAYFFQDLLVARRIYLAGPERHVDVGSRIDGFVAHVAVFREIDVLDIRPVTAQVLNVRFIQADLMQDEARLHALTDSLSCLHALEHFGLGRYGDRVDPQGHLKGFRALVNMLRPNATFYLSFPIGIPAVEFNAHRVFDCEEVLHWPGAEDLELTQFDFVDDAGALHQAIELGSIRRACEGLRHGCGIYTFVRK